MCKLAPLLILLLTSVAFAQDKTLSSGLMFSANTKVEKVWTGGEFTEGPAYGKDHCVYFSDIGNRIMKFDPATKITTEFRNPGGRSNGLDFDSTGRLVAAEGANTGGNRRISRTEKDGKITIIADNFEGKKFNSPNDLVIDSKNRIYFTDPRYVGKEPRELDHESVFMISSTGKVSIATRECKKPNGIVISPDGKTIYIAENDPQGNKHLVCFNIAEDGTLDTKKVLHDFGKSRGIDGMCVDEKGNIFATAGTGKETGVYVFNPMGKIIDFVNTPETSSNCIFAGKDRNILYITAGVSLYRIQVNTKGYHLCWPD